MQLPRIPRGRKVKKYIPMLLFFIAVLLPFSSAVGGDKRQLAVICGDGHYVPGQEG
jgi:ABC-type transport system involved in cytochrome c biogenesis permease component